MLPFPNQSLYATKIRHFSRDVELTFFFFKSVISKYALMRSDLLLNAVCTAYLRK